MALHCDCRPGEPVFFPTTTGWMVWNIMLGSAGLGLHRSSSTTARPPIPAEARLFDIIATEGVGVARIVPPMIDAYVTRGPAPAGNP